MPFTCTSFGKTTLYRAAMSCLGILTLAASLTAQTVTINCQSGCVNNVANAVAVITGAGGTITHLTIEDIPGSGTPINNLSGLSVLTGLTGNLNIRRMGQNGATVSDLSGLSNLASVGGSVNIGGTTVHANPALTNVTLAGLTSIGAALNVQYNNNAAVISFPLLTSIATNLTVANNGSGGSLAKTIGLPTLTSVGGALAVQNNGTGVSSIDFGSLNSIGGNASFNNIPADATTAAVNLGALGTVNGNLTLTRVLGSLTLNGLNATGGLTVSNNTGLTTLTTTGAVTLGGALSILNNTALTQINMPTPFGGPTASVNITGNTALQTVNLGLTDVTGNFTLQNNGTGVTSIVLDDLTNIGGNLSMLNTLSNAVAANINLSALNNIGGSANFTRTAGTINASTLNNIGGSLTIASNSTLANFDASFAALATIGGNLIVQNNPQLSTCCRILCDLIVNGTKNIFGNAPGCANMPNITTTCTALVCPGPQMRSTDPGECAYTGSFTDNLNCSLPTITYNLTGATISEPHPDLSGIAFNLGMTTVTATVTTSSPATTATCSFTVTVKDNEAPKLTCPTPVNPYSTAPGKCDTSLTFSAVASDNCGVTPIGYKIDTLSISFPHKFPLGSTTVVATVTDVNGNTTTCSFAVVVKDNQAPTITCPTPDTLYTGECYYKAVGAEFNPTLVNDNCTIDSVLYALSGATTGVGHSTLVDVQFNKGITLVTWTVKDKGGNTATCSFQVKVKALDSTPPTVACPTPANPYSTALGKCDTSLTFSVVATDSCGVGSIGYKIDSLSISFPHKFPVGSTTVVATVTDVNGNTATCSFTVVVQDEEAPKITCPSNTTVGTKSDTCMYVHADTTWNATATDNCAVYSIAYALDGVTSGTGVSLNGVAFNFGVTVVTWTATDGSGNTATCSFTVTVIDDDPPVVTSTAYGLPPGENPDIDDYECGDTVTVLIDAGCIALKTITRPVWEDNCWNPVTRSQSANNGVTLAVAPGMPGYVTGNFPAGITTVTFKGTDAANNTGTCTLNVWVKEPVPPVITFCPPSITVEAAPDSCAKALTFSPIATDNCGPVTFAYSVGGSPITLPFAFPVGETSVLVEAIDLSGNIAICLFSVKVVDTQPPSITCPKDTAVVTTSGCSALVSFAATAADNCTLSSLTYCCSFVSPFHFPIGTTVVIATAADNSGNTKTCTFSVTVTENVQPSFTSCPTAPFNLGCNPTTLPTAASAISAAGPAMDNCGTPTVTASSGAVVSSGCTRTQVWTVTATDKSGNTAV
ncbi:MAG: HYR domain-containing protein, partial [Saprospiraceae bacterium]|nr:HYR domain-containing protein [Saprospiraceae bacterium]